MRDEPSVPRACLFQGSLLLYFPTQRICMKAPQTPELERLATHSTRGERKNNIWNKYPKWWNHKHDWAFSAGSRQGKQRNTSAGLLWFSHPDESGFCVPELGLHRLSRNSIDYTSWRAIEANISIVAMFWFFIYVFMCLFVLPSFESNEKRGFSLNTKYFWGLSLYRPADESSCQEGSCQSVALPFWWLYLRVHMRQNPHHSQSWHLFRIELWLGKRYRDVSDSFLFLLAV